MSLAVLASGSSGNCAIVRSGKALLMIDAGIGPRAAANRLKQLGGDLDQLKAICLTHLDWDHFSPRWVNTLVARQVPIYCHQRHVAALVQRCGEQSAKEIEPLVRTFDGARFSPWEGLSAAPVPLAHDRSGSFGFLLQASRTRIGYATDLGHVPPGLLERFADVNIVALESNYDPALQLASGRPRRLIERITGGRGHLSNQQALTAIVHWLDQSEQTGRRPPEHIVLLHRSRQCNCPVLLKALFERDPRIAARLTLAEAHGPTQWLHASPRDFAPRLGQLELWSDMP